MAQEHYLGGIPEVTSDQFEHTPLHITLCLMCDKTSVIHNKRFPWMPMSEIL